MNEEVALALHNGSGHAQNSVKALLNVFNEPTRFLQPLLQTQMAFAFATTQCVGINIVNAQFGHHIRIELNSEMRFTAFACANDQHIGHDDMLFCIRKGAAWFGL